MFIVLVVAYNGSPLLLPKTVIDNPPQTSVPLTPCRTYRLFHYIITVVVLEIAL